MSRDIRAGGAFVELMLKDKRFRDGLAKNKARLKAFAAAAIKAGTVMAGLGAAAVVAGVKGFISFGDNLDKMAKRTGVSVEALSELKHAAELSGSSLATYEKGVGKLQRSLFDAERGLTTTTDALNEMNLSVEDFQGLSPEEQMNLMADGLSRIEDQSKRSALAQQLLGRAGRELLPMLQGGSAGLEEMRQAARDAGLTMSTESAAGAARLLDALTTLWSSTKAIFISLGGAVAPLAEMLVGPLQRAAAQTSHIFQAIGETVLQYKDVAAAAFTAVWETVKGAFTSIATLVGRVWSYIAGSTGETMSWFQDTVVGVLSALTFAFENWQQLGAMALVSAELSVVRFANQTVHFFGTVIPAWLGWLKDNWRDVFTDIWNITKTITVNIGKNLGELWQAIKRLATGEGWEFNWTPLTEGFESAIRELPQIAERELGPLEAGLQRELNGLAEGLVMDFEKHNREFRKSIAQFAPGEFDAAQAEIAAGGEGGAAVAAAAGGAQRTRDNVFASFSSAALMAQGQGASKDADKIVKAIHDAERRQTRELNRGERRIGP